MTRIVHDADEVACVRERTGDLVPVADEAPIQRPLPQFDPEQLCEEHGYAMGQRAAACICCWGEIHAGERPARHLGRIYLPTSPEETST